MTSRHEVAVRRFTSELAAAPAEVQRPVRHDAPRLIRKTVVDFSSLNLPEDARAAIAQAFWAHVGARSSRGIISYWNSMLVFERFAAESGAVRSVARLLQARDHLRAAAVVLHPARWEAVYAPPLRILEEDILPRFGANDLAAGEAQRSLLPPLPELR